MEKCLEACQVVLTFLTQCFGGAGVYFWTGERVGRAAGPRLAHLKEEPFHRFREPPSPIAGTEMDHLSQVADQNSSDSKSMQHATWKQAVSPAAFGEMRQRVISQQRTHARKTDPLADGQRTRMQTIPWELLGQLSFRQ